MKQKQVIVCMAIVIVATAYAGTAMAQSEDEQLTKTITKVDSGFWNAYNHCDSAHYIDFLSDDIEFYHDKGGVTLGAPALIQSLNKNICGNSNFRVRREAKAGTIVVYPMRNGNELYGAIISGEHGFFVTEPGKPENHTGDANFTDLWQLKNGVWKMTRILSFNHHEPGYMNNHKEISLSTAQLDKLAGTFKSAQSGTMTVSRNEKHLVLKDGKNSFELFAESGKQFFTKTRDLVFEFVLTGAGKPAKIIVRENGKLADELLLEK